MINPVGVITDTYAYDAFGNSVARTGSTVNPYQYRGEQFDSSLGMYYLRTRYYIPRTGRFLTADKYEGEEMGGCDCASRSTRESPVGTHHLFGYASADPVNLFDPSGKGFIGYSIIEGTSEPVGYYGAWEAFRIFTVGMCWELRILKYAIFDRSIPTPLAEICDVWGLIGPFIP